MNISFSHNILKATSKLSFFKFHVGRIASSLAAEKVADKRLPPFIELASYILLTSTRSYCRQILFPCLAEFFIRRAEKSLDK